MAINLSISVLPIVALLGYVPRATDDISYLIGQAIAQDQLLTGEEYAFSVDPQTGTITKYGYPPFEMQDLNDLHHEESTGFLDDNGEWGDWGCQETNRFLAAHPNLAPRLTMEPITEKIPSLRGIRPLGTLKRDISSRKGGKNA